MAERGAVDVRLMPEGTAEALAAIKQRVAGDQYIQHDFTVGDQQVTAFSADGQRKSLAELQDAAQQWASTGKAPKGFVVLPPGLQQRLRSGYEAVREPVTQGLTQAGTILDKPLSLLLGETQEQNVAVNRGLSEQVVGTTPAETGRNAALMAASPLLRAVTAGATAAQPGALLVKNLLANAGLMGGAAAGGTVTANTLTGSNQGQTYGQVAVNDIAIPAAQAAIMQGGLGVVNFFINKALPNVGQKIAGEMLDVMKGQYPSGMINSPGFFDAAVGNKANVAKLAQVGVKGLREELETTTNGLITNINQTLPRNLTTGTQNTVRAQLRIINTAGNDILSNLSNGTVKASAEEAMEAARLKILDAVKADLAKLSPAVQQKATDAVDNIVNAKLGEAALRPLRQGAEVLHALRTATAQDGFNIQTFINTIRGNYQEQPGSLLEQIGKIAGRGYPLTEGAMQPGSSSLPAKAANYLIDQIPFIGRMIPNIPTGTAPTGPLLPWQLPYQLPRPANAAATAAGGDALKSFIGGNK